MRQFDRPARRGPSGFTAFDNPAMLVCAALALAVIVLSMRIASLW